MKCDKTICPEEDCLIDCPHHPENGSQPEEEVLKPAEYEEKFIVINTKRFDEMGGLLPVVKELLDKISNLERVYEVMTNRKMDQKYYVVNQDEPYADEVFRLILDGETKKNRRSP